MSRLRDRSKVCFESLGHFVCRYRFKAALAVLALTASLVPVARVKKTIKIN
jgi:hypothetical protein